MTSFRSLVATGALVAATAALLSPAPSSYAAAPARPQVGSCHALTYAEGSANADPDPAVPCDRPHTSRTIKVLTTSRKVVRNPEAAFRAGLRGCLPALTQALGGTASSRAVSAYDVFFFIPTKAQIRQGATWIRCDLTLLGDRALLPLPTDETPALGALPHPDGVALCGQLTRRGFFSTACTRDHDYRAVKAFKIPIKRYPGFDRLLRIAQRRCPSLAGRTWYASWTSQASWPHTDHQMVCYRKTRA